ncbi:hypothetical protein K4L44_13275 [Halosquirtibacter laminarini]|uniref:Uncharacterized protein n=1 Tax=Halosquirtibacter laminarini TaxID=3374600 RepID=A0AC61NDD3_9BACT|nr:hypothetical protein K4L44_13275 [Prolixibacteraceae bacterium]
MAYYQKREGDEQSASISLYDLNYIPTMEHCMQHICAIERDILISSNGVQRLHQKMDCYDMVDMIDKNYNMEAQKRVRSCMQEFLLYHQHTDNLLSSLSLTRSHGISCFIPTQNTSCYASFYQNLCWSQRTGYGNSLFNISK